MLVVEDVVGLPICGSGPPQAESPTAAPASMRPSRVLLTAMSVRPRGSQSYREAGWPCVGQTVTLSVGAETRYAKTITLSVPAYELFRALAGRRHADQVSQWDWSADPQQYIDAGLPYPFRWANSVLDD